MDDPALRRLLAGFRAFRARHCEREPEAWDRLVREGQRPEVLVVGCSDSRVDPALLLDARPGELFVVRNVAALVPPHAPDGGEHGTAAAIEFAVRVLGVRHAIVLGHGRCAGIAAARQGVPAGCGDYLAPWTRIVADAVAGLEDAAEMERAGVRRSLENLRTYPWVREAEAAGRLAVHGWRFDLERGRLEGYDEAAGVFRPLAP